jgi:DEAD/DEAH box helicase domain-containing protein
MNLLMRDAGKKSLPPKALAEDQLHEFRQPRPDGQIRAFTYDGDTPRTRASHPPAGQRGADQSRHAAPGILPHHKWARYFENLRYIVIDELHYRGVYGSHFANLRVVLRVAEFYNSSRASPAARQPPPIRARPKRPASRATGGRTRRAAKNSSSSPRPW